MSSRTIQRYRRAFEDSRGMTLVELVVVIVIIGVMFAVLVKGVLGTGASAKARINETALKNVQAKVEQYRLEYNIYPSTLQDLVRPSSDRRDNSKPFFPLLEEEQLNDVYGFPFVYKAENNSRSYSLKSLGSDGLEGGEGAKQDIEVRPQ